MEKCKLDKDIDKIIQSDLTNLPARWDEVIDLVATTITGPISAPLLILRGIVKIYTGIRDTIYLRKLYKFIYHIRDIPLHQRVEFLKDINSKKYLCSNFSFYLLSVIEKIDDIEKAEILSFIFRKMVYKKISLEIGFRAINFIEKIHFQDIPTVYGRDLGSLINNTEGVSDSLIGLGILTPIESNGVIVFTDKLGEDNIPSNFKLNSFGETIRKLLYEFYFEYK